MKKENCCCGSLLYNFYLRVNFYSVHVSHKMLNFCFWNIQGLSSLTFGLKSTNLLIEWLTLTETWCWSDVSTLCPTGYREIVPPWKLNSIYSDDEIFHFTKWNLCQTCIIQDSQIWKDYFDFLYSHHTAPLNNPDQWINFTQQPVKNWWKNWNPSNVINPVVLITSECLNIALQKLGGLPKQRNVAVIQRRCQ